MDISEEMEELRGYKSLSLAFLVEILTPYFQVGTSVDVLGEILENCVPREESGDSLVDAISNATLRKIVSGERDLPKKHASKLLQNFDPNGFELYLKERLDAVSEQALPALRENLAKYVSEIITDENIPQVLAERIQNLIELAATAERKNARKESPFPKEMGDWESEEHRYKKTINGHKVERIEKANGKEYVSKTLLINGKKVLEETSQNGVEDVLIGNIKKDKTVMHYELDSLENIGTPVYTRVPLEKVSPDDPKLKQYLKEQERIKNELKKSGINISDESDANITDE
ncbi:MAG: hypothetical protein HDR33_01930 [Treponema sp.]|nr:hypothetical protein [Treponema sp.]